MPTIPTANVTISAEAGALAGGTGYCFVSGAVAQNADGKPRVFSSGKALLAFHGYSPATSYVALHIERTRKPVLFSGLPIVTPGAVGRQNASGVTGTSVISVSDGADGYLEEVAGRVRVVTGGTIGTNGIVLEVSADGGINWKRVRLGTATSYTFPYLGIVVSFGAGTLVAGDEYSFATTAPKWDSDGITSARTQLAEQQKTARSWMVIGDVSTDTEAGYVTTNVNAYATANQRFMFARVNVRDRLPFAEMSRTSVRMTGNPNVTFAEVGATGDTITRSAGSFITDGFVAGMAIDVSGSGSNNFTKAKITTVSASTLTLDTQDLVAEGPVGNVTIVGSHGLTFAEVGATGDTITRSGGSWLADGFRAGDRITVEDTASNNFASALVTTVTATVLTLDTQDLAAEFAGSKDVTITAGEEMAAWVSAMDDEFASVADQPRIDIALGRARVTCPITGWSFRRPASWHISIREYQHDIHHPTWTKEDGPLLDVSLEDADGVKVEYDERTDGGALAALFSCLRTWSNGPEGAFVAMSLTRAEEGSALSFTHNEAVANVACSVIQKATENFIGKTPELKSDGTMTAKWVEKLEEAVNTDLAAALRREFVPGEGPRASLAVWRSSTDDVLTGTDATVTGAGDLRVNGTIVNVDTNVRVR